MFKIVEKFISINGEGTKMGQLAVFIRFQGCNLNCTYCDTKWANATECEYDLMTKEEIYEYIKITEINNITITGGEPLINDNISDLLYYLSKDSQLNIEIETNGSLNLNSFINISNNIKFTMDYKLPGSEMENYMCIENFNYLSKHDTIKFVVGSIEDLDKARFIIKKYELTNKCNVFFSSVFNKIELLTIVEYMKKYKMNKVILQLQLHKIIWDSSLRGV